MPREKESVKPCLEKFLEIFFAEILMKLLKIYPHDLLQESLETFSNGKNEQISDEVH